jgi:Kef-type K+ transport system membrane component KefB
MLHLPTLPLEEPAWVFALLMVVVLLAPVLAERVRLPAIVGLVLVGTVIGPTGLGLIEREGIVDLLGTAGLLYLMFMAGLELDLDQFKEHRRDSVAFGVATFVLPMVISVPVTMVIGYDLLPAVLLASCWASHTLLTYPVFRRFGVANNRAVATSVGATIITDTAALLVLVVVARAYAGDLDPMFWVTLTVSLAVLAFLILWALPRVAQWFFRVASSDRTPRLVFLLVALFAASAVAELAGVEAIIGAFLAGLAINRLVPLESALMERVEVLGNSLFIPLFLISVGMLIDPAVLIEPATLGTAAVFVALAIGTKWIAAEGAGRFLRYDRVERTSMFALTGAQAAATLAAVFVGLNVGLLDTEVVNAVIVVILATSLVTSWAADRSAARLPAPGRSRTLGRAVLVPIVRPASAGPLAALAAAIARQDGGMVVPVTVVTPDADEDRIEEAEAVTAEAERVAMAEGVEAHGVTRVDADPTAGILHTILQRKVTLLVVGWKGASLSRGALFGTMTDALVTQAPVATLIARLNHSRWRRIVVAVSAGDLDPRGLPGVHLALVAAQRLARDRRVEVQVWTERDDPLLTALVTDILETEPKVQDRRRLATLLDRCDREDLVLVAAQPDSRSMHGAVARLARALDGPDLVAAVDHRPVADRRQAGNELRARFEDPDEAASNAPIA